MSHQTNRAGNKPLEKMPTGITGFDEITAGGLPRHRATLVVGGPGSGKTIFALQTLVNGARFWAEPGIFVAFEENSRQIIANAASFGWDLPALEKEKLFFLDARPSPDMVTTGEFDLSGLLAGLTAKANELGAKRIVFDSVDALLSLLEHPQSERTELYRLHAWLTQSGLTGLITSKGHVDQPLESQRYGFMQYTADCLILLGHRLIDRVSLREMRVAKYRGSTFAENEFPMVIGPAGIEVASFGVAELDYPVTTDRVTSGVPLLDTMLGGGYYRGSSVLITGAPGTAKSTLGGIFAEASCGQGERTLHVSFDEVSSEIVRNLASVNIRLEPHLVSGLLHMYSARTEARSAEEHLIRLKALIEAFQPQGIVIDPLSAMLKAGGSVPALGVAQRLLYLTKSQGITLVCTSLLDDDIAQPESTPLKISTVADTWIHLSYAVQGGERNRALSIIKARGTAHSNQVRELILSHQGIALADVYTAGGDVLMGTLRWEREAEVKQQQERTQVDLQRKQRELELAEAEAQARAIAIQRELEARRAELNLLQREQSALEKRWHTKADEIRTLRAGEPERPVDKEETAK